MKRRFILKKVRKSVCFAVVLWISLYLTGPYGAYGIIDKDKSGPNSPVIFKAADIDGKKVSTLNSTASMILFFDAKNITHKLVMSYANIIYKKYSSKGLKAIGVSYRDKNTLGEFSKAGKFLFPFVSDPGYGIFDRFKIGRCCGVVILDKNGKIKFSMSPLGDKTTLRQLVEKELLGKILYEFKKPDSKPFFNLEKPAPLIELTDISTNKPVKFADFPEEYIIATFFSSMCPTCKTGQRITLLKDTDEMLQKGNVNAKTLLVFFDPFDKKDILQWEKSIDMPFDKLTAVDIFSDEERYVTNNSTIPDPFTVVLDKNRKVIFLETHNPAEPDFSGGVVKAIMKSQK